MIFNNAEGCEGSSTSSYDLDKSAAVEGIFLHN